MKPFNRKGMSKCKLNLSYLDKTRFSGSENGFMSSVTNVAQSVGRYFSKKKIGNRKEEGTDIDSLSKSGSRESIHPGIPISTPNTEYHIYGRKENDIIPEILNFEEEIPRKLTRQRIPNTL